MEKRIILFLLILLPMALVTKAQKIVLDEGPNPGKNLDFGPNEKNFVYTSFGFGYALKDNSDFPLLYGTPNRWLFSIGYKRKLSRIFSLGFAGRFEYDKFRIKQTDSASLTDLYFWGGNMSHLKERFTRAGVGAEVYFRSNFDPKRGEYLGYYLDIGAGATFGDLHYYVSDKGKDGSKVYTGVTNMLITNDLQYDVFGRLGFNVVSIGLHYRISDYFDLSKGTYNPESKGLSELPRYMLTLELTPYSH